MPDLKLTAVLEAADPERLRPALEPFLGPDATPALEMTRLQPPLCFWAVYRHGDKWAVFKSFFSETEYAGYVDQLEQHYADRLGQPDHPNGGIVLLPDLNGLIWAFPFDPAMPRLWRCADAEWIGAAVRPRDPRPLEAIVVDYNPEIGTIFKFRDPARNKVVAFGRATPHETCGLLYLVTDRLWRSPARESGQLRIPKPIAFRPEADLLVQARVYGKPIGADRNRAVFVDLVKAAGATIAGVHSADIPFGPEKKLDYIVGRLEEGLDEVALTAPPLHDALRRLTDQIKLRAERTAEAPLVPSHGDFKHDQLLRYRRQFILIDFEMYCQSEPWLDVGTFCAYLPPSRPSDWRESAAAEVLRGTFLRAYEKAMGVPLDLPRLSLYEAGMLGVRGLAHVWRQEPGWQLRASELFDLAIERLVSPEPSATRELASV